MPKERERERHREEPEDPESYQAIVEKIIPDGRNGPYAVAYVEELGVVTVSLDPSVWQEQRRPSPGTYIMLSEVVKTRGGWRAEVGRFVKPSDEPTTERTGSNRK